MSKCIDPKLGALLPAYELGGLSEEEMKQFEIHMMNCEHCLNEVQSFHKYSNVLSKSDKARMQIARLSADQAGRNKVFVFRPAFAAVAVLILLVPAIIGIISIFNDNDYNDPVRPVQRIRLSDTRSAQMGIIAKNDGFDVTVEFALPGYSDNGKYDLQLFGNRDRELMNIKGYDQYDQRGMGEIIIPNSQVELGEYRLIIEYTDSSGSSKEHVYEFRIK